MPTDPVSSAAGRALEELLEVSPQVDAAVVLDRDDGSLLASAPPPSGRTAEQLGATCVKIVDAAERARRELGREPVSQIEVATPDGHVFVVADSNWIVSAVTDADPTVGLVFYDLKTALRTVREARGSNGEASAERSSNGSTPVTVVPTSEASTSQGDDDGALPADGEPATRSAPRWRRRKQ